MKKQWFHTTLLIAVSMPALTQAQQLEIRLEQHLVENRMSVFHLYEVGDVVRFELQAVNTGQLDGSGLVIDYSWPDGLEFLEVRSQPTAATELSATGERLSWYVDQLAAQNSGRANLLVLGRLQSSAAGQDIRGNLQLVASDQPASIENADPVQFAVRSLATVDLAVSGTATSSRGNGFFTADFTFTVTNAGPDTAQGVLLAVVIDPFTFNEIEDGNFIPPAGVTCDDVLLTCELGDIAAGSSIDVRATARVLFDSTPIGIPFDVSVSSNDTDTDLTNNQAFPSVFLPEVEVDEGGGAVGTPLLILIGGYLFTRRRLAGSAVA